MSGPTRDELERAYKRLSRAERDELRALAERRQKRTRRSKTRDDDQDRRAGPTLHEITLRLLGERLRAARAEERGVVVWASKNLARVVDDEGVAHRLRVAKGVLDLDRSGLVVGDEVTIGRAGEDDAPMVIGREERRTSVTRRDPRDARKTRTLAANIDLALIVVSVAEPAMRERLIDRVLVALGTGGVAALIVASKADLLPGLPDAERIRVRDALRVHKDAGRDVVYCSASTGEGLDEVRARVEGKTSAFVGQSGVGKSTLLNALVPEANARTSGVRESDHKGRHTTTSAKLYRLPGGGLIIDTPGVRSFALAARTPEEIREHFDEFAPFAARCRFTDCSHTHEPGCSVLEAVERGEISRARYDSYRRLLESVESGDG